MAMIQQEGRFALVYMYIFPLVQPHLTTQRKQRQLKQLMIGKS